MYLAILARRPRRWAWFQKATTAKLLVRLLLVTGNSIKISSDIQPSYGWPIRTGKRNFIILLYYNFGLYFGCARKVFKRIHQFQPVYERGLAIETKKKKSTSVIDCVFASVYSHLSEHYIYVYVSYRPPYSAACPLSPPALLFYRSEYRRVGLVKSIRLMRSISKLENTRFLSRWCWDRTS